MLDGWADFHPPRGVEHIGTSPDDNAFGPRFTGTITRVERPLIDGTSFSNVRTEPAHYGPIQLNLIKREVELRLEDQFVWRTEMPPLDVSPSTVVPVVTIYPYRESRPLVPPTSSRPSAFRGLRSPSRSSNTFEPLNLPRKF